MSLQLTLIHGCHQVMLPSFYDCCRRRRGSQGAFRALKEATIYGGRLTRPFALILSVIGIQAGTNEGHVSNAVVYCIDLWTGGLILADFQDSHHHGMVVCRAPPGAESADFSVGPPAGDSEAAATAWDAYWGFDCAAKRGLCDAAYSHLHITEFSWQALKLLPLVSTGTLKLLHAAYSRLLSTHLTAKRTCRIDLRAVWLCARIAMQLTRLHGDAGGAVWKQR